MRASFYLGGYFRLKNAGITQKLSTPPCSLQVWAGYGSEIVQCGFLRVMPQKNQGPHYGHGQVSRDFEFQILAFARQVPAELKSFVFSTSMHPQVLVPTLVHIPKLRGFWQGENRLLTVDVSKPFNGRENNEEKIGTSNPVISMEGQSLTYSAT